MPFPLITDQWKYDEQECQGILQKLWWNRTPNSEFFTLNGQESEELVNFIGQIANVLLKSSPNPVLVKTNDRTVEYNLEKLHRDRWCAVAFIDRVNGDGILDTTSVGIAFSPVQNSLVEHLIIWIALWLWD